MTEKRKNREDLYVCKFYSLNPSNYLVYNAF